MVVEDWHFEGDRLIIGLSESQISESRIYGLFIDNMIGVPVETKLRPDTPETLNFDRVTELFLRLQPWWVAVAGVIAGAMLGYTLAFVG